MADAVRHDLAGQVDLDGRVDRRHPAERADDVGVVGEIDLAHLDHRVVRDEVVEALGAHHEGGHDLAPVAFLATAVDDALLDEIDDDVGEHLGVDAEVALVGERLADGGGNAADAHLDRGPVGDQVGHELADARFDLAELADEMLVRRHVALHRQVDLIDVDEALAERSRHALVELDDDGLGRPDRGMHGLDAGTQRAEAVGVGRRRVDEHGVEWQEPAVEQARDVGQEGRDVLGPAFVDRGPGVGPDEQRPMAEVRLHLRGEVGTRSLAVKVDDADVLELGCPCHEGIEEDRGGRRGAVEVDLIA